MKFIKGFSFSFLLGFLYLLFCPLIFSLVLMKFIESKNFWVSNLSLLLVSFLSSLVVLFILKRDLITQTKNFFQNPKPIIKKGLKYWGLGFLVMIISNLVVSSIVGDIPVNEQMARSQITDYPLYAIPTAILIGPILEEVIFRFSLRKCFNKELTFALFSAFIFGFLHVVSAIDEFTLNNIINHLKEVLYIIPYGSLGYFFAKAYYETENIYSSIIPHILHNSISIGIVIFSNFIG